MASERRLHPASFIFILGSQVRQMLVPAIALLFTARTTEAGWQLVTMILVIPFALIAVVRALVFRYRTDEEELVIRSGVIFRSVRHVPYKRVHNIDAVQNLLHRLFGVAEVRIETGGGTEPEAAIQVLSMEAFQELRQHVLAKRAPAVVPAPGEEAVETTAPASDVILTLSPRELMLAGFIQNRAAIVVAAAFGLVWEFGLADRIMGRLFGRDMPGRGVARQLLVALSAAADPRARAALRPRRHSSAAARAPPAVDGLDARHALRLHARPAGHGPARRVRPPHAGDDDDAAEAGADVDRAGGGAASPVRTRDGARADGRIVHRRRRRGAPPRGDRADPAARRPPAVRRCRAARYGRRAGAVGPAAPGAFRRAFVVSSVMLILFTSWLAMWLQWWWFALLPLLLAWAAFSARKYVANLWWGTTDNAVLFGAAGCAAT
jgi:membrane protein YdbS with pleckstrin-like domain